MQTEKLKNIVKASCKLKREYAHIVSKFPTEKNLNFYPRKASIKISFCLVSVLVWILTPYFTQWALSFNDMNLASSRNIVVKSSKTRGTKIFTPGLIVAQTSSCKECVKINATHMSYYCIMLIFV